jgi:TrwC relaxase
VVVIAAEHAVVEGLPVVQREAGYAGARLDDDPAEPVTRWLDADLAGTSWLHHLSAALNPHLHVHNQVAAIARTRQDGWWREVWAEGLAQATPALAAVEIDGISQGMMDAFSP